MSTIQDDSHTQTQGTGIPTQESPLVSASAYLRTGNGSVCPGGSSRRERFRWEVGLLGEWAEIAGFSLTFEYLQKLKPVSSGAEHDVYYDPSGHQAIKLTKPGGYGHSLSGEGETASPSEYLTRQLCQNEVFGDYIEMVGVLCGDHQPQILISQPWITASSHDPVPTEDEIDDYFESLGFDRVRCVDVPAYYHEETGLVVLDAHAQNILRDETGRLVPIDVVIGYASGWVSRWLGLENTEP